MNNNEKLDKISYYGDIIEPIKGLSIEKEMLAEVESYYNLKKSVKMVGTLNSFGSVIYEGEYIATKRDNKSYQYYPHGDGKIYYLCGGKLQYEGKFYFGHPHGEGKFYSEEGNLKYEGLFETTVFPYAVLDNYVYFCTADFMTKGSIKKGKLYRDNGTVEYEGEFDDYEFNGEGILYDENGKVAFAGIFKDGQAYKEQKVKVNADYEITDVDILNQGVELRRRGRFEEAKEKYIEAIKINHKNFVSYYNLGKILYILGDYKASVKAYKVAYELGGYGKTVEESILWHLGHSLLDEKNKNSMYSKVILEYEKQMKSVKNYVFKGSMLLINQYRVICINEARNFLSREEE